MITLETSDHSLCMTEINKLLNTHPLVINNLNDNNLHMKGESEKTNIFMNNLFAIFFGESSSFNMTYKALMSNRRLDVNFIINYLKIFVREFEEEENAFNNYKRMLSKDAENLSGKNYLFKHF